MRRTATAQSVVGRQRRGQATAEAFVPLSFVPGEAYQFDWSHEIVVLNGVTTTVKVAHVRLCHSRMMFVRAYPRETQEMVFDAHDRAFAMFKGTCGRGIYDNMKTAVETVSIGKDRAFNRRFLQMCSHYLVEPTACTPAAGWEEGQVENQVGLVRERFFTPRLRFKTYDELNGWLVDQCVVYAKAHAHPERPEETVWSAFQAERPSLVACAGRSDGFHAVPASVSKTCLVRFDNNKYSVMAKALGRPVEIHAYADRIVIRQDGAIVADCSNLPLASNGSFGSALIDNQGNGADGSYRWESVVRKGVSSGGAISTTAAPRDLSLLRPANGRSCPAITRNGGM